MSDDLPTSLKLLRATATHLNKLTDQANDSVRRVESYLSEECHIGTAAFVLVDGALENEHAFEITQVLAYEKVGSRFRIVVGYYNSTTETEDVTPWSDCSRDVKLKTIKKLPDLLNAITKQLNVRIKEAEEVNASVSKVVQALTGKGA